MSNVRNSTFAKSVCTGYFQSALLSRVEIQEFLPFNMSPSRFLTVDFFGIDMVEISPSDENLNIAIIILSNAFKGIIDNFGVSHVLSRPEFVYTSGTKNSQAKFSLKVGMLPREVYEIFRAEKSNV